MNLSCATSGDCWHLTAQASRIGPTPQRLRQILFLQPQVIRIPRIQHRLHARRNPGIGDCRGEQPIDVGPSETNGTVNRHFLEAIQDRSVTQARMAYRVTGAATPPPRAVPQGSRPGNSDGSGQAGSS